MIRYIIVDDEHIAHDIIKKYCNVLPNFTLVKHCYDAIEAIECLQKHEVDLIFLDLNMPELTGFEFLRTLTNPPKVIVTTAYKEHALEGYELNIVDYLLKPFSLERFIKAINKVVTKKEATTTTLPIKQEEESLFLRSSKKIIQLKINSILFIESVGNYVKIVTKDKEIQIREKISNINDLLPSNEFFRVHKSFIVAKIHINEIEGNRIKINDYTIPIGKVYKANINSLF